MAYHPRQNSWFEFQIVHLNFQLQHLNVIAEFKILHFSFRIHIIGQRFYTRLFELNFELNFFIWPCLPYIFNSLCQISQSNHSIFHSTSKHWANFYALLVWCLNQYSTFDWDRNFAFDTHSAHFASHHVILQTHDLVYFQLNFWSFVYASVITKAAA